MVAEALVESLTSVASDTGKQVLVATHSTEILRNAQPSDILQIRSGGRGGRYLREVLRTLARKLDLTWPTDWVERPTARMQKERKQVYLALREEVPGLLVLSLRDRDDEKAETVGADLVDPAPAAEQGFRPRRWRRRHIESYLVWSPAIAAASGLPEDEVNRLLAERHGIAVTPEFTSWNPAPAWLDLRGKSILRQGSVAVLGQFDVTVTEVAEHMTPDAICDDIKTFLDELVSCG